ncbi:MAG: Hsp20/alpha crystallin family protein [Spirochaetales bacterium]|jgi:HSP20 family protein|nr:Hsp20/alpha crystallin family protein [Spirochaetales bacterium]
MYKSIFDELLRFNNEMNKYFGTAGTNRYNQKPSVNVYENQNEYLVISKVPGVKKEDVALSVKDNVLHIAATRKPIADENAAMHLCERECGTFERNISFEDKIQADAISADMKDGILYIKAPKVPETQPMTIAIN